MRKIILNLAITLIFVSGFAVQNSNKDNGKIESQKHNNLLHNENKTFISLDEAEQIAINYFSLNKKDINFTKRETDFDDGIYSYEFEFKVGRSEYEITVDSESGIILESDIDKNKS